MTIRSILGSVAVVLVLVVVALLMGRGGMGAVPSPRATVEIAGDTLPAGSVPGHIAALIEQGRTWRAARALRDFLRGSVEPAPDAILLAAVTEGESGGWEAARDYLDDRGWLDEIQGGQGWFWVARAREETGDPESALAAYDRFLSIAGADGGPRSSTAELRRGLLLLGLGRTTEGAEVLAAVRDRAPGIAGWMDLLAAEALAPGGDTAAVRRAGDGLPEAGGMRHRVRVARVRAHEAAGDLGAGSRLAASLRGQGGSAAQRAELATLAGRLALEAGQREVARRELRVALDAAPASAAAGEAANLLLSVPSLTRDERLAIATSDDRRGNRARAIEGYRTWLAGAAGGAQRDDVRLRLGSAQFNEGENAAAETTLLPLHDAAAEVARQAMLLTGRAQYRRGNRQEAFRTFDRLAERFPGSVEASEGLYLVADLQHEDDQRTAAAGVYRRVADGFRGTDRAGLALMRLAGMQYLAENYPQAAATWEEYRATYPSGQRWLEASYWAARAYEAAGDAGRAQPIFGSIRQRDPLSYYALLASDRLGQSYWPPPMGAAPGDDPAAAGRVAERIRGLDLLREAGLYTEADAEAQRLADLASAEPGLAYPLAEALNERGYAIRGIRIGQQIEQRSGQLNPRLLRILYPFPYRALIEAEAVEQGLDPFVVAALTRQESLFTARISSPVGARGLMQIMPQTGLQLARGAGIDGWDAELLFHPEINVHLGTRYLAEQMRQYDASLPSVFSAYNAGPHRIDAWKAFPEYGNEELFTERIPFRETRDYVKILTRNIALYRGLYGDPERLGGP